MFRHVTADAEFAVSLVKGLTDAAVIQPLGGILEAFNDDAGFAALQAEARAIEALRKGIAMVEYHGQAFEVRQP